MEDYFTRPHDPAAPEDQRAAEVHEHFQLGWFLEPLLTGDYPPLMRALVDANSEGRSRLPHFTEEERALLAGASV